MGGEAVNMEQEMAVSEDFTRIEKVACSHVCMAPHTCDPVTSAFANPHGCEWARYVSQ